MTPLAITDLNREGGIGSNCLLVEAGPFRFVVDAGLHPKLAGPEAAPAFARLRGKPLDFAILTHCHLDHLGAFPLILKAFPELDVLMSPPSQVLAERMLRNSCNVMKRQKAEQNIPEYPLFTHEDVDIVCRSFEALPFGGQRTYASQGETISVTLHAAGHVAGAGGFEVAYRDRRVLFSGDVLFEPLLTIPGARFPERPDIDTLVLETTRGEVEPDPEVTRQSETERLLKTIANTHRRGGSTLIPVFALGRMQEIFTLLNDARKRGELPDCPVFGAGLGIDLAGYLDLLSKRSEAVRFSQKSMKELRLRRPPRSLIPGKDPGEQGIYVLSSGMLVERTPSYAMAACLLPRARNAICFVGYCAPETPGGQLLATRPGETFAFEALDYETPVRAQVERFEMSGHADREELVAFARQIRPRTIVLTHGDPGARDWFRGQLAAEGEPAPRVVDPVPLEPISI